MDKVVSGNSIIYLNKRGESAVVEASLRKSVMSDDVASYKVASKKPIPIKINDTIDIFGQTYRLNSPPSVVKRSESLYEYSLEFQGKMWDLNRCQFFNADATGFKTDADFSLIGTIDVFLACLKNNMIRFSPGWTVGSFTNGETKTVAFSEDSCLSALQKICSEFNCEFRIDDANGQSVINTGNFGQVLPFTFSYGKGRGLYSIERTNVSDQSIVNRLYVAGGDENLPNAYRNFAKKLKFSDAGYLEDAVMIAEMGLKEGFLDLPDIYPHRTGKVTALGSTKYKFIDNTMDFDLNEKETDGITTKYLKPDTVAKIHFNTGNLAGYEFEIKKGGYNSTTKEFEIIPFKNEQGQQFPDPNAIAFQMNVGDEYVIIDIWAPEIYITNAENALLAKAQEEFAKVKGAKVNYRLDLDEVFLKSNTNGEHPFNIGDSLKVIDTKLGIDKQIKIVGFTRNLIQKWKYTIDVADSYEVAYSSKIALQVSGINNSIATQSQQIAQNYLSGYKRLTELNDLVFDSDGYFDMGKIKPLSIETNMLSVGSKSQMLTLEGVKIEPNYNSDKNKISCSAGKLIHFTINEAQIVEWNFVSAILNATDDNSAYYLYAKCPTSGNQGEWYLTTDKIKFNQIPDFYHFLIGVLHKVSGDVRFYTPLEGATMINGRYITTGKVQSVDGSTWFDLDLSAIMLANYGGMTGRQNPLFGLNSAAVWFGENYDNREDAPFKVTMNGDIGIKSKTGTGVNQAFYLENGEILWRDENGTIRRRIGIEGGVPYDRTYNSTGVLIYEIDNTGFHTYAQAESWQQVPLNFVGVLPMTDDKIRDALISGVIYGEIINWKPNLKKTRFSSVENISTWKYSGGNVQGGNAQYEGYKNTQNKNDNVQDGWYIPFIGVYKTLNGPSVIIDIDSEGNQQEILLPPGHNLTYTATQNSFNVELWKIESGKKTDIKVITVYIT